MKERRNRHGKPAKAVVLDTKRPRAAKEAPKKAKPRAEGPDLELLSAVRNWQSARPGESATDEALSASERPGRFRLKGSLDRFFRHYARLRWLIERQDMAVTAELLWGLAVVMLDKVDPGVAAKAVAVTTQDVRTLASAFGRMSGEGFQHPDMPEDVRLECPPDLAPVLRQAFGDRFATEMAALGMNAPLDIRANALKTDRDALAATLGETQVEMRPMPYAPLGLRARGRPDLAGTPAFEAGLFDMQDEGSQLVALLVGAESGQQVLDFCAGAGGKSLALAADMKNKGHLVASDTNPKRLTRARLRFKRAGAENAERIQLTGRDDDPFLKRRANWFDRVLVDAPCSGTGAWRRHPEMKWKSGHGLERLVSLQKSILARAAKLTKRGGRLVYATCSVVPDENERQVDAFLKDHSNFKLVPASDVWSGSQTLPWPCAQTQYLKLTPAQHGTDGFFAAVLERTA